VAKGIPYKPASQVLQLLNNEGQILLQDLIAMEHNDVNTITHNRLYELAPPLPPANLESFIAQTPTAQPFVHPEHQTPLAGPGAVLQAGAYNYDDNNNHPSVPGYTTVDDLGSSGDDTIHAPIRFYDVPNCISSNVGFDPADGADPPETVDLIYNEFVQDWVLLALRYLGVKYEKADTEETLEGKTMTDVISDWVGEFWGC
jgi:hypothetical protein